MKSNSISAGVQICDLTFDILMMQLWQDPFLFGYVIENEYPTYCPLASLQTPFAQS